MPLHSRRSLVPLATVLLASCAAVDPTPASDIVISLEAVAPYKTAATLTGTLIVNGRAVPIDARTLISDASSGTIATPPLQLGDGLATFSFVVRAPSGEVMAQGTMTHLIGESSTNSITVHARPTKRADFMYAFCGGALSPFPVAAAGRSVLGDSVFVQASGIPKGAVC